MMKTSRTLHPDRPHLRISDEYHRLRNTIVECELFLIRILGFHFQFNHPNKYLLHYLDTLSKWMTVTPATPVGTSSSPSNLVDVAMSILQDTYYDYTLIKDFQPQHVAIAIIYLLVKTYALDIPGLNNEDEQLDWMKVCENRKTEKLFVFFLCIQVFSSTMTNDILVQIISRINTVYQHVERTLSSSKAR